MERFETSILPHGDANVNLPDQGKQFILDSTEGYAFGVELLQHIGEQYPALIKAVEQKHKLMNPKNFAVMKVNHKVYVEKVVHTICCCCFGELSDTLDYDGTYYNMEYPRQCRDMKFCPWNGYAKRNENSMMVICGAKRNYNLTPQEIRVCHLIQEGYASQDVIADTMRLTKASIHKFLNKIYYKTNTTTMVELVNLLKHVRV